MRVAMTLLPSPHGRRGEGTPWRCVSALPARPGRQAPPHAPLEVLGRWLGAHTHRDRTELPWHWVQARAVDKRGI